MNLKLELVPIPVTDVDRAKAFYVDSLGFVEDVDVRPADGVRVVQLTPPGCKLDAALSESSAVKKFDKLMYRFGFGANSQVIPAPRGVSHGSSVKPFAAR